MIFCISEVLVVTFPFSFMILLIWVLSPFFLCKSGYRFIDLIYLFKVPAFSFIDLLFSSLCFYFCPELCDFFPSTDLGFNLFFLLSFKFKDMLFI